MKPVRDMSKERARKRPSDLAEIIGRRAGAAARAYSEADRAHKRSVADAASDAMEVAFHCACEIKARTPAGALAQIVAAADTAVELGHFLESPTDADSHEVYLARMAHRRLMRVLYSVRAVLEEISGQSADLYGAETVMGEHLDPHAALWERAA